MGIPGLRIDPHSVVPVYQQIVEGVRAALQSGRLEPGRRLPPTRDLARQLGVNRNTVVAAYDELAAAGMVESHTGRGTFLAVAPAPRRAEPAPQPAWFTFSRAVEGTRVGSLVSAYSLAISTEGISFAGSYPASDLLPIEGFRRAVATAMRERGAELLAYGPTQGQPALREALAADMRARGSAVEADDILVTNGSQQAIELVLRSLVDPGDVVLVEDPTYTGALSVLGALDARAVGVPGDEQGVRTDLLALALERHRPRVLYVQPTFHNPTARVTSEPRRRELLELAARHRCVVIEDDWAGDLRMDGADLPTLHALDDSRHVVYLSTFSKKLLPGIRVGWVAAARPVIERLVTLKQVSDFGTSPLLQAALHQFLVDGGLDDHLRRIRRVYRERRDAMMEALDRHLAGVATWTRPEGGLFVWVRLLGDVDSTELSVAARSRGVLFSRGELFHVEGTGRDCLRLTYAASTPAEIDAGVRVLGELIAERHAMGTRRAPRRHAEAVPIL